MKRLLLGAAVRAALLAALAALSLVCLCLSGCRRGGDDARKAGYQACMGKAKAAGVLNPGTQPEIDAACQDRAQQDQ